ncbi:MAG: hypothetical protein WDA27_02810 [Actinomycetota bacterium]
MSARIRHRPTIAAVSFLFLVACGTGVDTAEPHASPTPQSPRPSASAPSPSPTPSEEWRTYTRSDGLFSMSYPASWKVRTKRGYLTLLGSTDGSVHYEIYAEDNGGSFDEYRSGIEAGVEFGRHRGGVTTGGEVTVDARRAFFIHGVSDEEEPANWSGEEWCSGCVGRQYFIDWSATEVLSFSGGAGRRWSKHGETIERIVASLRH